MVFITARKSSIDEESFEISMLSFAMFLSLDSLKICTIPRRTSSSALHPHT